MPTSDHTIPDDIDGATLSAALRRVSPGLSWSVAKRLITGRRVLVNDALSTNDARRVAAGDRVTILEEPRETPSSRTVRLLHIDPDLVVVDKPPGVLSQRPDEEREFPEEKKSLQPTLEELVQRMLPGGAPLARVTRKNQAPPRLAPIYVVHRLDRDTSGLMLYALSARAREAFIDLFTRHAINRTYHAVCLGRLDAPRTFDTHIVRDRGDSLRGSTPLLPPPEDAKRAITHVRPLEHIGDAYTLLECRLETGRTHQIRIHLAEAGHMLCGERLYTRPTADAATVPDPSAAPRQALHSTTLSFAHPITGQELSFHSPWPRDLAPWLAHLRSVTSPTPA